MEQSTKTILWIVAFITLPLTIPLTLISLSMAAGLFFIVLAVIMSWPIEIMTVTAIVVILYGVYKWLSRNG